MMNLPAQTKGSLQISWPTRLKQLEANGLISKIKDEENRRRNIYLPTGKALDLLPMMLEMVLWSATHDANTAAPAAIIKQIRNDRNGYIAGLRKKFQASVP